MSRFFRDSPYVPSRLGSRGKYWEGGVARSKSIRVESWLEEGCLGIVGAGSVTEATNRWTIRISRRVPRLAASNFAELKFSSRIAALPRSSSLWRERGEAKVTQYPRPSSPIDAPVCLIAPFAAIHGA